MCRRHLGTGKCLLVFGGTKGSCQEHWTGSLPCRAGLMEGKTNGPRLVGGTDFLLQKLLTSLSYFLSTKEVVSDIHL